MAGPSVQATLVADNIRHWQGTIFGPVSSWLNFERNDMRAIMRVEAQEESVLTNSNSYYCYYRKILAMREELLKLTLKFQESTLSSHPR